MFFFLFYSVSTFYYCIYFLRCIQMQQNCNNAKLVQLVQQNDGEGLSLTCHFDVINVIRLSFCESMCKMYNIDFDYYIFSFLGLMAQMTQNTMSFCVINFGVSFCNF